MLEAFDIKYMPRIEVKGQVLPNLVVEFTEGGEEGERSGKLGGKAIEVFSNSRLVVGKINGEFKAKDQ